jgi:peptidoglycan/LPS O-acetylase OafA/YrhL
MVTSTYPAMLWAFIPGMLLALLPNGDQRFARPWFLVGGIVLLAIGTASPWASLDVPSALGSFLLVAWTIARRPSLGPAAILASVGAALTYSVYLWHVDVIRAFGGGLPSVVACAGIATVVYVVIERPVLRIARSRTPRRVPARTPGEALVSGAPDGLASAG